MKIGLLNIALELFRNKKFKNIKSVVDMGSKEIRVNFQNMKNSYHQAGIKFDEKKYAILKKFPKGKRISTKKFWQDMGVKNYKSVDINKTYNSIFFDLNFPMKSKKYFNKFDLVIDFGNNEHIFNVGESYKTLYNLCKKDGFIWIFQAVFRGNGFFHFDQSFFEGYAAANNLSIVHSCYVVNVDEYNQIVVPCDKNLFDILDLSKVFNVHISYVFRKKTNEKFKYYYQYNLDKKDSPYLVTFINNSYPPEKMYIPTKKISEFKKLARRGDTDAITWLRSVGIKY
tara:strand:- start:3298 stop:4149 length:852 start_codon:yes stop_codon:yes gene_type:complete